MTISPRLSLQHAAPMRVAVQLYNKETENIKEHEIYMGDLPVMTDTGSFVINGAERVIVSQLVRSPGVYFTIDHDKTGGGGCSANRACYMAGASVTARAEIQYETDSNDVFYVRVDRTRKVPVTVLMRALGLGTNEEIISFFGDEPKLRATIQKDTSDSYATGLIELMKKIRPGELMSTESAASLLDGMLFDPRRYDLARVGRYKYNKKLHFRHRITRAMSWQRTWWMRIPAKSGEILAGGELASQRDGGRWRIPSRMPASTMSLST